MLICHIQTRLTNGGADENTVLTCNAQARAGHKVVLIHGPEFHHGKVEDLDDRVGRMVLPALQRPVNLFRDVLALLELVVLLTCLDPDIVHTHTSKAGVLGRLAGRLVGVPAIIHGVHILPYLNVGQARRLAYLEAEKVVGRFTDAFICVSEGMLRTNVSERIGDPARHFVVPSGMDVARFRDPPVTRLTEVVPHVNAGSNSPKVVLFIGALEKRKRQVEFLHEFKKITEQVPDVVLLLVGEGKNRDAIEQTICDLDLAKRVFLLGFRSDPERLIHLADVCVLASRREGLARVLIQYCLGGRPIVCTHTEGAEAIVHDGVNGYLTPVDDLSQMVEPIVRLLANEDLRRRFCRASASRDLSAWSVQNMVSQMESIYHKVMSAKRAQEAGAEAT